MRTFHIYFPVGCQIYGMVTLIAGLASIWAITAITCERFCVITSGFSGQNKFSVKTITIILAVTWTSSIAFSVFPLFGWNSYVFEVSITILVFFFGEKWSFSRTGNK